MRKFFEIGGFLAAAVLVVFGFGALYMAYNGHNTVHNTLAQENIVGSPDMTPAQIKAEAKQAGLDVNSITFPKDSVANLPINSGSRAHDFALYMRIHALEATGGKTYAEMGEAMLVYKDGRVWMDGRRLGERVVKLSGELGEAAVRKFASGLLRGVVKWVRE